MVRKRYCERKMTIAIIFPLCFWGMAASSAGSAFPMKVRDFANRCFANLGPHSL